MKTTGFALFISVFAATAAHADPICGTLDDCLLLQAKVASRARELSSPPEALTSVSGHKFTRVSTQPAGKTAWKDESDQIWGDIVTKDALTKEDVQKYCSDDGDSGPCKMTEQNADAYCSAIGAQLPTKYQFERLTKYLGEGSDSGYIPEILPSLTNINFWSKSEFDTPPNLEYYVYASSNSHQVPQFPVSPSEGWSYYPVRCVW